jgi:hypothetical protein
MPDKRRKQRGGLVRAAKPRRGEDTESDWIARRNAIGFRQVFRSSETWGIDLALLARLLGTSPRTLRRWMQLADAGSRLAVSPDTTERLSYLLGIHKALVILYPTPGNRAHWLRHANADPVFNGQSPLERMAAGRVENLCAVRSYLDRTRY